MSILNLRGWQVLSVPDHQHDYVVEARYEPEPTACVHCQAVGKLYKHGSKVQRIMDVPTHGKRMGIDCNRLRYRCTACGKTFLQPLPDLHESGSMTKRLVTYIERQSLERPFTQIAAEVGVDEKTVRNVFNEYIDYLDGHVRFETPEWLGLDEVFLLNRPRCVLTNIKKATVIDLLEDRNKKTLHERLFWMEGKERVKVVTMDMWKPYKDAARTILPDAQVVVDKFHVVRMASNALESVRRRLRDSMNTTMRRKLMRSRYLILKRREELTPEERDTVEAWTADLPELAMAYGLKEQFYDLFDLHDPKEAWAVYQRWERDIPQEVAGVFKPIVTAMNNWRDEIMAYFTYRATNALTEALNGVLKITHRTGRGYSFRAIRAKTIYAKPMRVEKDRFGGKPRQTKTKRATDMPEVHVITKDDIIAIDGNVLLTAGVEYARLFETLRGLGNTIIVAEEFLNDVKKLTHPTPKSE